MYVLQNILSDFVCQNETSFDDVKNEDGISSKLINSSQYTNIKDDYNIIGVSHCRSHCHRHVNNCNDTINQRPCRYSVFQENHKY